MILDTDKLIGWLCIARHQFSNGVECMMPTDVSMALIERGWLKECDRQDSCDTWNAHLTDAGMVVTDLNASEWGINPIPEEAEA